MADKVDDLLLLSVTPCESYKELDITFASRFASKITTEALANKGSGQLKPFWSGNILKRFYEGLGGKLNVLRCYFEKITHNALRNSWEKEIKARRFMFDGDGIGSVSLTFDSTN